MVTMNQFSEKSEANFVKSEIWKVQKLVAKKNCANSTNWLVGWKDFGDQTFREISKCQI